MGAGNRRGNGMAGDTGRLGFAKMHGAGNDFMVIDARDGTPVPPPELIARLADRHRGVGFDQLAVIRASDSADLALAFFNADGTPSATCGNATRCIAWAEMRRGGRDRLTIETGRGVLAAERAGEGARVNLGPPLLDWRDVPLAAPADTAALPIAGAPLACSMGNPHCTFLVEDAEAVDLPAHGAALEHHPLFPERTNVEFASLAGPDRLRLRIWERGTGVTLASGSCAAAAGVAAARRGLTGRKVEIMADGGLIGIDWRDDGVWLEGPVAHVYDGTLDPLMPEAG